MNGILNIDKEQGMTSHDVVAKLRRILKIRRIGHTGTLDPNAEGVLPICIGQATKLSELLTDKEKVYLAELRLGTCTDTQDAWGKIVEEHAVEVTLDDVKAAVFSFVGDIFQIPPMYSAIKQNGKKLYELAREGKEVERPKRPVTIYQISDFSQIGEKEYRFTVKCSRGAYIRTLCHDIGQKLGCGAHMTRLIRLQSGIFLRHRALKLAEVEKMHHRGELEKHLVLAEEAFDFPHFQVSEAFGKWLYAGNPVPFSQLEGELVFSPLAPEEKDALCCLNELKRTAESPIRKDLVFSALTEERKDAIFCPNELERTAELPASKEQVYLYDHTQRLVGIYTVDREKKSLRVCKFLYQIGETEHD